MSVVQTVPLDFQWATANPFLFCVHHLDRYPAANDRLGPAASLAGRSLGNDFEPRDGWRMYHGDEVPGFPSHPHRGFETITFVRRGLIDHSDSLGMAARYGRGDVQWMTAGAGIVHSEMFPLLDRDGPNTVELFQIWLNLPAADKFVEPHFTMFWDADIPRVPVGDPSAPHGEITVIAGEIDGVGPLSPPPASWASRPDADVAIWHLVLESGTATLPPARDGVVRTLYLFDGGPVDVDGTALTGSTGAVVAPGSATTIEAAGHAELLVLQGRPLDEPVVQYGPFVMNTRAEIQQAFEDYRRTGFGGWPWDRPDPTHGTSDERFARMGDRILTPA